MITVFYKFDAKGNDIPDAYHATLVLEWNCQWVTMDKGFKKIGITIMIADIVRKKGTEHLQF